MPKERIILLALIFLAATTIFLATTTMLIFFRVGGVLLYNKESSIPDYHKKTEPINPLVVCKKIKNRELQNLCFSILLKTSDYENKLNSGLLYKNLGTFCYKKRSKDKCCLYYAKESYTIENFKWFLGVHTLFKSHPNYINHQKALLLNPYFCNAMTFWNSFMFDGPKRENCYRDAAFVWKDPSLCEKTKDKDFCYFCVAINND